MARSSGKGGYGAARWQEYQTGAAGADARTGGFRGGSQVAPTRKSGQQASRVILWGGLAGALVAVLIVILMSLPHPTPVILLAVTDYAGEFAPPNAYALEDSQRLEGLLTPRGWTYRDYRVHSMARNRNQPEGIRASLLEALDEVGQSESIVLYLSAHGAVDHEGRAVLLAENFDPDDLAGKDDAGKRDYPHWTAVEQLLADLREKLPAETRKIVFLDANRAPFYWQLPVGRNPFENPFAAALEQAVSNAKVPNLYVINSASPGQVGWSGAELGGSVFGYYVGRGLAGPGDLDRSGEIMLDELVHYVRQNVARWAENHRLATQVPPIYGLAEVEAGQPRKIPAVKVADASAPDLLEVASGGEDAGALEAVMKSQTAAGLEHIEKERAKLQDLWSRHAELAPYALASAAEGGDVLPPFSRQPARWARLELLLVRAEQYLFAGQAYREEHFPGAVAEAQRILAELEAAPDAPPAVSLPLARQSGETGYRELAERLEAAASGPLSRDAVSRLVEDLNAAPARSPEPVELLFIRMLEAHDEHLPHKLDLSGILPTALRLRLLAERAAAPTDPRAVPWAREALDEDQENRRRQLEDRLFLGTEDGHQIAELGRSFEKLRDEYQASADRVESVARAYRARDEALSALPHLAQWNLMGLGIAARRSQSEATADYVNQHLQQLEHVNTWRQQAEATGRNLISTDDDLTVSLPDLAAMHKVIDTIPGQFRGQAGDEEQPRQMWLALQTPLLTGSERADIRDRFLTLVKGRASVVPADAEIPPVPADEGAEDSDRRKMYDWSSLLAAFISTGGEAAATSSDTRDRLEQQDHEVRATATQTAYRRRYTEVTPTLLRLSRYRQYVWLARRAVDDFWGPPPGADGEPYFAKVVAACRGPIDRAKTVAKEMGGRLPDQDAEKELGRLLAERLEASRQGIHFAEASSLRAEPLNPLFVQYPDAGLPDGQAVAWTNAEFALKVGEKSGARMALATANPPSDCGLLFTGNLDSEEQKVARLAVLFRGHVWKSDPLPLPTGQFRTVLWKKPAPAPTRVTVEGDEKQVPYVLFILDCSKSMDVAFKKEGAGPGRISRAKSTLGDVVDNLLRTSPEKYEIGLMFYGRRYEDDAGQPKDRFGNAATWEQVLTDVELVMGRQKLNSDTRSKVHAALDELKGKYNGALGITPLYAALSEALDQAQVLAQDQVMQIVLLTDGEDTQQDYKNWLIENNRVPEFTRRFRATSAADVQTKLAPLRGRVVIDVIGLDFGGQSSSVATLAKRTGGDFHFVDETLALQAKIDELLRPAQFSVRHVARSEPQGAPIDLEDTWIVREENLGGGQEFIVAMHRVENPPEARVLLSGREHLRLRYLRDSSVSSSLVHSRYRDTLALGEKRFVEIENVANPLARRVPFSPAACYVAAHMPERGAGGSAVFRVSVQNEEEREFSLRPRHVWAEIRPRLDDRPPDEWPVFPFFDLHFEQDMPVPVLMFTIPEWTWDETIYAEIRLWCSYEPDLNVRALPLQIGAEAREQQDLGRVDTLPDVKFEARIIPAGDPQPFQVIVSEYHNEEPMDLYSARVQMSPEPDAVRHLYYTEGNLVRHEFTFESATVLGIKEAKILVTPRDVIQSRTASIAVDGRSVGGQEIGPLQIRVPGR